MTIPRNWQRAFSGFLSAYLNLLDNRKQRDCVPRYVRSLLAPLERKSTQPIAEHVRIPYQRLHHFLNVSAWDAGAFELRLKTDCAVVKRVNAGRHRLPASVLRWFRRTVARG